MTIDRQLGYSKYVMKWVHENTNELSIKREMKLYGVSLLQHSLDIGDAIIILVESNLPGPSLSLCRPLLESYVRGVWLLEVATESEIQKFIGGKCPNFPTLVSAIESSGDPAGKWIKETVDLNLKSFHDLTHGGIEQVARRFSEDAIEPTYPDDEVSNVLALASDIQMAVSARLLELANDTKALMDLVELQRSNKLAT
ncbi:DUF6988 family protein [Colwellia sp. E150_009]